MTRNLLLRCGKYVAIGYLILVSAMPDTLGGYLLLLPMFFLACYGVFTLADDLKSPKDFVVRVIVIRKGEEDS